MKVFPNKDDSLPSSLKSETVMSIVPAFLSTLPSTWLCDRHRLSQMEMLESTDDFL